MRKSPAANLQDQIASGPVNSARAYAFFQSAASGGRSLMHSYVQISVPSRLNASGSQRARNA